MREEESAQDMNAQDMNEYQLSERQLNAKQSALPSDRAKQGTIELAKMVKSQRVVHNDIVDDPYEWLRNKESEEVQQYVAAQNVYCEQRNAHLEGLRTTLFAELKSHVQETDMSVPTRVNGYWYFSRTQEGQQYATQCRLPIQNENDWEPPEVEVCGKPGSMPGEEIVFDANVEASGHDFFRLGGLDLSHDGRWLLYGVDTRGDERYDFKLRDLQSGLDCGETIESIGGACLTPDGKWVFYVVLDEAWRPCAIRRHEVGTPVSDDVEVFREHDERFWVGVGLSFDERNIVIGTGSKTTTEVLMMPVETPQGEFRAFIPREKDVEYDVSFACFEGAGENGEDIPLAVVYHNAANPNFEIDVIDMRTHEAPYRIGEGVCIASGSPYGCEMGDTVEPNARHEAIGTPYFNSGNPQILQGARGLGIEGIALHRHFVVLSYRSQGLPRIAVMTKQDAVQDFLHSRPWGFKELHTPEHALCSVSTGGNPSYDAPRMRYSYGSYTLPGELHELDPATGKDTLLKRAEVLGDFDKERYEERRVWVVARDGERVPVSLVWRKDKCNLDDLLENSELTLNADWRTADPSAKRCDAPMFITGYGAYEISSDPGFSVARLSLLDRGVLYAVAHIRGGGEMGRAWYEQGRRLEKKHSFEDFVDVTRALQINGFADASRTVANGGSAGGLLMGAVANMAPECFAGIEADVPFVDALTSILDPSLPLTVTEWDEWGDPLRDEEVYRYMKSYTPYENAPSAEHPVRNFPKIFVTTSMNDTRVLYVEPLKWVARLQAAGVDAIAKIEVEAGHGGISGRYKQWEEVSYENAWCCDVMGVHKSE